MCRMNVTHGRRQFELGGGDVWADKWTACFCSFYFLFFADDKINRQREPLMIAQDRADTTRFLYGGHRLCAGTKLLTVLLGGRKCQNKCHRLCFSAQRALLCYTFI